MTEPRVVTESLGGNPLGRMAVEERGPEDWYPVRPHGPNEWREHALRVRSEHGAEWAERLAPAFVHRDASAARLARVVEGGGVVVTTGQQPGLFGGPIYTTAKALSVLALADALEKETGIPTAPVFWAATDDADFAEASWTVVVIDGAAQELRIPRPADSDGQPLFAVPLPRVDTLLARMEEASGSGVDPRPLSFVRQSYGAGTTIGAAFVQLLADLLGPLGISVLDAGHEVVRVTGFPLLQRALERAQDVQRAVADREAAIRRAGCTPQVEGIVGRTLVFDLETGKVRVGVERAGAVAQMARPGSLSPNVLLRPVVERALLPTVAYMAGSAELAYLAQSSAVAQALGAAVPLGVPRWSGTIVEPHVDRMCAELGIAVTDLAALHEVEGRLARSVVPASWDGELRALRGAIDERIAELRTNVASNAHLPLSAEAIEGARRALQFRVDRLERRMLAAAKHSDRARLRRVAAAAASVYPFGKRQERTANLIPFLARYGMGLLDAMRREAAAHASRLVAGQPIL